MRYFSMFTLVVTLLSLFSCQSGTALSFTPPPNGLADTVIVPAELQAEYDRLVASEALPQLPANLEQMSLTERRALALYIYAVSEDIDSYRLYLVCPAARRESATRAAVMLINQLDLLPVLDAYESGTIYDTTDWRITLSFFGNRSRGEIAWYGDWILKSYPDEFLIYYQGSPITLASP